MLKKIPKARHQELNKIEKEILKYIIDSLPERYDFKLKKQMNFLVLIKRIDYSGDISTEFYPEKMDSIPDELLFERREEFHLCTIYFTINDINYKCEAHMVLGSLFDIKIKPKVPTIKNADKIVFKSIKIVENLSKNVY